MNFTFIRFRVLSRFHRLTLSKGFYPKYPPSKTLSCQRSFVTLQIFSGLAFIWTGKKKEEKTKEEKVPSQDPSILERADNFFEHGQYQDSYNLLMHAENLDDVEIKWRLCRVLYNMSKETTENKKQKKQLIDQAYEIISQLILKHQDHFAVQKWYALLLDAKSSYEGIKQRIQQLEHVKKHMDLAATLNPNDATTLHMLGEWCYQVAEMPWHQRKIAEAFFASPPHSTYEDALEYFLRAETAQPRFYSVNLLRLGSCYMKLNMEDQAKYYLKLATSYPAKSNDDHQANKEAADLLKKIK